MAAYFGFLFVNWDTYIPESWSISAGVRGGVFDVINEVVYILMIFLLPTSLGVLIVYQKSDNPIGWLLIALGIANVVIQFVREVTIFANFTSTPPLSISPLINLIQNQIWVWVFIILFGLLSIFPDGKLPSKGWRFILVGIFILGLGIILSSTIEDPMQSAFFLANPLPLPEFTHTIYQVFRIISIVFGILMVVLGLSAYYIMRFVRAKGVQRQQYKWLGLSVLFTGIVIPIGTILGVFMGSIGGQLLLRYSLILVPVGIGIAVLRFRLYDIDVIIRRTLVYAAITILLIIIYFGTVLLMQFLLAAFTGQQSPIAIVISTLIIAALFNPLRIRVQEFIDRQFYRRKYDAEKAMSAFAEAARDEVELQNLVHALLNVSQDTMQPDNASLWLLSERRAVS
jgi:hypothetical protein